MAIAHEKQIPHGTFGGYANHKCRCDDCRAAAVAYRREHPPSHIPKGLTKGEALVLLDMVDESLDSIAATFGVTREDILMLVRSRTRLGPAFRRSPAPLRDRIFIVEEDDDLPEDESSISVGKKSPAISNQQSSATRDQEQPSIIRRSHVGYVDHRSAHPLSRLIALRAFVSEEPLSCHGCGKECSGGMSRELDNGPGVPHTFRVHCAECDPSDMPEHPDGPLKLSPVNANDTGYLAQVTVDEYRWSKRGNGYVRKR